MKSEKSLWSSISLLIGAVIIILSLFRGAWQVGLLLVVFALWAGWVVKFLLMPYINQAKRRMMRKAQRERRFSDVLLQTENIHTPITIYLDREARQPVRLSSISCLSYNKRDNWQTTTALGQSCPHGRLFAILLL